MNASPSYNLYRPDIDGLRAIAVLSVILFHAQLSCSGGFVGVDIFFVISGYLITRIVQRDLESHRFSILEFYQRRIRRIFPAFFAMLLVSAVLGLWLLPPDELQDLGKCMVGASTFCSNIFSFHRSGYFDNSSIYQPLLHTWTLSIEEQFYIFWPLILAVLSISLLARWKLWLVFLILGASLLLSCYLVNHDGNAAFYLLPSRAWELTLGSVLSIAPFPQLLGRMPRLTAHVMSILGLLMLATSITLYNSSILYPGLAALAPCLGTMFIIAAGEGGSSLGGSILSELPLVHIGRISYSLYLWHWPILVFARVFVNGELSLVQRYGCVAITVIISWLSWRFVESPFRNPKIIEGQSRIWVVGGLVTAALFTVLGIVLFSSEGFPQRSPEVARWVAEQRNDYSIFTRSPCMAWKESLPPVHGCLLGAGGPELGYSLVLWGDSNAAHLAPALADAGLKLGVATRLISKANCPPLLGIRVLPDNPTITDCPAFNEAAINLLLADQKVRVVVLAARWIDLANGTTVVGPTRGQYRGVYGSRELFIASLRKTVETVVNSGRHVILIGQVPVPNVNPLTCLARARFNHLDETPCLSMSAIRPSEEEAVVNQALSTGVNKLPIVQIVHPYNLMCRDQRCELVSNGLPLFWDLGHLSDAGAGIIEGSIEEQVASSLGIDPQRTRTAPHKRCGHERQADRQTRRDQSRRYSGYPSGRAD